MDEVKKLYREENVWYFAYGSNMLRQKFSGDRGIKPIAAARMFIPEWCLTMSIPGLPYKEPAFSVVRPSPTGLVKETGSDRRAILVPPPATGTAYLITTSQYRRVIASEGGGTAYKEISIRAFPVGEQDEKLTGSYAQVLTLGAGMLRTPEARPSRRYLVRTVINTISCSCSGRWRYRMASAFSQADRC